MSQREGGIVWKGRDWTFLFAFGLVMSFFVLLDAVFVAYNWYVSGGRETALGRVLEVNLLIAAILFAAFLLWPRKVEEVEE